MTIGSPPSTLLAHQTDTQARGLPDCRNHTALLQTEVRCLSRAGRSSYPRALCSYLVSVDKWSMCFEQIDESRSGRRGVLIKGIQYGRQVASGNPEHNHARVLELGFGVPGGGIRT